MKKIILITLSSFFLLSSCLPKPEDLLQNSDATVLATENLIVSPDFDFKTSDKIAINISILNGQDKPLKSIPFSIYADLSNELIFSGMTNLNGEFAITKEIGNHIQNLTFKTDFIGIPNRSR